MIPKPLDCIGVPLGGRGKLDSHMPPKKPINPMLRTGLLLQKLFAADGNLIHATLKEPENNNDQ